MRFYIVDAFTEEIFGGNPAGVVLLGESDFPEEELMQKTAAELRYSETAFVHRISERHFHARYFTPTSEVDLCGHATIALFHALAQEGEAKGDCRLQTLAGELGITLDDGTIFMEMGEPKVYGKVTEQSALEELYSVMGIKEHKPKDSEKLLPELVSVGLPDIILPVPDEKALEKITPDFPALSKLSEKYEVVGVHSFSINSEDGKIHVRNFAPLFGIDEEAATGTANGALTYYLYRNGLINIGDRTVFVQGEAMDRRSEVLSLLTITEYKPIIRIGGRAKTLAKGEIYLEK